MTAQLWRGWTKSEDARAYVSLLQTRILEQLDKLKACKGTYVLRRPALAGKVEFLVLTLFNGVRVIHDRDNAPDEPACISNEEKSLLCCHDEGVSQYEVVTDSQRTLLYSSLRCRFPLRIMAPR